MSKHANHKYPLQLGIDIGSSTVARGVVSLVLGYLNNLVIEMAFLVQVKEFLSFKFLTEVSFGRLNFHWAIVPPTIIIFVSVPSYIASKPH